MTSSSSTSGSGSQSSQSVPSSMDSSGTLPTQDCVDGNWSENEDVDESIWGKLYPVGKGFNLLGMGVLNIHSVAFKRIPALATCCSR